MQYSPVSMHIPDGFLSVTVGILFWIISIIVLAVALRKTGQSLAERQVPLMGVLAAAIFAGQMLNFSVTGGTSGHLLGAALATIVLGPWPAMLVMTAVVSVQALVFQDGGLIALGANLFNMAVVGVSVSYAVYSLVQRLARGKSWGLFGGGFVAAWTSIFIASLSCALQLALSGTSPANIAVPAMAVIHALIGVGEGLITGGALAFLFSARRDLVQAGEGKPGSSRGVVVGGLVISVLLVVLSPLASSHPDGLEWVAEEQGFLSRAQEAAYDLVPDYVMPGINNEAAATIAAGILGAAVVFGVVIAAMHLQKNGASAKID
ncbi:MAG: energy-coupling factor ABC transporter permease [Anaerolineaceae bacterium]|jgi:cobalt/nickel transport system permease protein|nr:energy-coupling factor ABC transporter permease [Anaerolineaceae bacterium]